MNKIKATIWIAKVIPEYTYYAHKVMKRLIIVNPKKNAVFKQNIFVFNQK